MVYIKVNSKDLDVSYGDKGYLYKDIVFIDMNNPPVNALSVSFIKQFYNALEQISADTKMVIFKSSTKGFCAGADLKERVQMNDRSTVETVKSIGELFQKIESISCPTIAVIDGFALGGGLELALSCDFKFATSNSILGLPETSLGIIPGAGGTQRLPRLIGLSKAKKWIFTAKKFDASKALEDGVIDEMFDDLDQIWSFLNKFIVDIKDNSQNAVSLSKKAINYAFESSLKEGLLFEKEQYLKTLNSPDRLKKIKK